MKPQTQILMVALAITFAIGLALTVTLICLSFVKEGAGQNLPLSSEEEHTEVYQPIPESTAPPTDTSAPSTEAPADPPKDPEPQGNGLLYGSNGNGTCRLLSIGTCLDACVVIPEYSPAGDRVIAVEPRAFYECATVSAIQIPASVKSIGGLAFAGCKNLVYISVSEKNPYYCDLDGVLYTADHKTLLLYPPLRAGSYANISADVTDIAEMAFYDCTYLRTIVYGGTPEQWEHIRIASKNYSLTAAAKSFWGGK